MPNPSAENASVGKLLLSIAALLGAVVLYQVAQYDVITAEVQQTAAAAMTVRPTQAGEKAEREGPSKSLAAKLKEKNLFMPPKPETHPVQKVEGILGHEALINGKWYEAGDKVGEAEVLVVAATYVKVSWNGQEKEFAPNGSEDGPGRPSGGPPPSAMRRRSARPPERGQRPMPGPRPSAPAVNRRPEMPERMELPRGQLSPEDMKRLREQMRKRAAARSR